jgi:hypothetical protein
VAVVSTFAVYYRRPDLEDGPWRMNHAIGFESLEHARQSAEACARMGFDALVNDPAGHQVYFVAAELPRPPVVAVGPLTGTAVPR